MKYSINEQEDYYGYIYVTLDQKYNKLYVGQKKGKIEKSVNYYGSGAIITNVKKDRGTYFLKKTILGVCYSKKELTFWETECKYFFNALDRKYGYNILEKDTGGDTLSNHPDKINIGKRISSSKIERGCLKNIPKTKEHRENISKGRTGIIFTEEHCNNISKIRTGTKGTKETSEKISKRVSGKGNPMYGSTFEWYNNRKQNKRCTNKNKEELIQHGYIEGYIIKK